MVDLKTLDEETLYSIWSDCCNNRWPHVIGQKPDGFDDLIEEKRWHHVFAKRSKQDYLHPIGVAALSLVSEEFRDKKMQEYWDKRDQDLYLQKNEAQRIISLCYGCIPSLRRREKKAIREYCSKYPG